MKRSVSSAAMPCSSPKRRQSVVLPAPGWPKKKKTVTFSLPTRRRRAAPARASVAQRRLPGVVVTVARRLSPALRRALRRAGTGGDARLSLGLVRQPGADVLEHALQPAPRQPAGAWNRRREAGLPADAGACAVLAQQHVGVVVTQRQAGAQLVGEALGSVERDDLFGELVTPAAHAPQGTGAVGRGRP